MASCKNVTPGKFKIYFFHVCQTLSPKFKILLQSINEEVVYGTLASYLAMPIDLIGFSPPDFGDGNDQ